MADYNIERISPARAYMDAQDWQFSRDQAQQRNALAMLGAQQDQQRLDMDRQQIEARQQRAAEQDAAAMEAANKAWAQNAFEIVRRDPSKIPVFKRMMKARGLLPPNEPEEATEEDLAEIAMANGIQMGAPESDGLKIGNFNPGDYTPDSFARFMQSQNPQDLQRYVTPAQDKIVMIGGVPNAYNPRGGDPRALSTPEAEAAAKQREAAAAASGRLVGETQTQAAIDLPKVLATAEQSLAVLDQLYKSKGFNYLYGKYSYAPIVGGTPQADADALLQQIGGAAFLQAFESLKGGGQITQVEGDKATAAITRLTQRRQQPSAARAALRELQDIIRKGMERAKQRAGGATSAAPAARVRFDENGNMVR